MTRRAWRDLATVRNSARETWASSGAVGPELAGPPAVCRRLRFHPEEFGSLRAVRTPFFGERWTYSVSRQAGEFVDLELGLHAAAAADAEGEDTLGGHEFEGLRACTAKGVRSGIPWSGRRGP